MSLSVLSRVAPSRPLIGRFVVLRFASTTPSRPASAKQVEVPSNIPGFFKYERDVSRDKRYANPQKPGDLPSRYLLRRLGHAYEVYPLIFLVTGWFAMFLYVVYFSFEKVEVWLDRSQSTAPWDWSRLKDNYYKQPTVIFDLDGRTHKRCELMEVLQDEMLEAAKKRGTR